MLCFFLLSLLPLGFFSGIERLLLGLSRVTILICVQVGQSVVSEPSSDPQR